MGTRGTCGFRLDGKDYLSYNHSDSYPSGLGETIDRDVRALMRKGGIKGMKEAVRKLKMVDDRGEVSESEIQTLAKHGINPSECGQSPGKSLTWYSLIRDLQGELKKTLEVGYMVDYSGFMLDSLFCEWGYIVNLDDETLEVYKGFQESKHDKGRYATDKPNDGGYYPCALVKTFKLSKLPVKWYNKIEKDE